MTNDEYREQLVRLQNAFIEGKIDRATYEQFKAELRETTQADTSDDDHTSPPSPPERPEWLRGKEARGVVKVESRPRTNPPAKANEGSSGSPAASSSRAADASSAAAEVYGVRETEVNGGVRRTPVDRPDCSNAAVAGASVARQFVDALCSRETVNSAIEAAAYAGVLTALRVKTAGLVVPTAAAVANGVVWAVTVGAPALAGIALYKSLKSLQSLAKDEPVPSRAVPIKVALVALALAAALFWIFVGWLYGELVGRVVGARFGHVNAQAGALVGMLLGAYQAWRKLFPPRPAGPGRESRNAGDREA